MLGCSMILYAACALLIAAVNGVRLSSQHADALLLEQHLGAVSGAETLQRLSKLTRKEKLELKAAEKVAKKWYKGHTIREIILEQLQAHDVVTRELAKSLALDLAFQLFCSPDVEQVHLALTGNPSEMTLSWANVCTVDVDQSYNFVLELMEAETLVIAAFRAIRDAYLPEDQVLASTLLQTDATLPNVTATTVTWWPKGSESSCSTNGPPSGSLNAQGQNTHYFVSVEHWATLTDLEPSTPYCYRIGEGSNEFSGSFTSPLAADSGDSFYFLGAADIGTTGGALETFAALTKVIQQGDETYQVLIHQCDIGYGDDALLDNNQNVTAKAVNLKGLGPFQYEVIYDQFMTYIEPYASMIPYMTAPGNHDVTCHFFGDTLCADSQRNFSAYRHRFQMPASNPGSSGMWYSFDIGAIHFVAVDSESDYPNSPDTFTSWMRQGGGFGDQLAWLENDLAAASASSTTKFIFAYGHRPLYSTVRNDLPLGATRNFRKVFMPIFQKYGVQIYMGAHVHNYERYQQAPDRKGQVQMPALMIVNGAGGQVEGPTEEGPESKTNPLYVTGTYSFGYMKYFYDATDESLNGEFVLTTGPNAGTVSDSWKLLTNGTIFSTN